MTLRGGREGGTEIGKMMAKSEKGDEAKMGEDARGSDDQARLWD